MDLMAAIKNRLTKYPGIRYEEGEGTITVFPADGSGFEVSLSVGSHEYVVSFSGWQEHFTEPEDALNCFAWGLSEQCRLKVSYRGTAPHRWTVEYLKGGKWVEDSTTGLLLFPFWRKHEFKYFQNRLIRNVESKTVLLVSILYFFSSH